MRKQDRARERAVVAVARSFGPCGVQSRDVLTVLCASDEHDAARVKDLLRALSRSSSKLPPSFWQRNGSGGSASTLGKVHPLVRLRVPGISPVIYSARDYVHVPACRDAASGQLRLCPLCGSSLFEYEVVGGTFDPRCRIVPLLKRVLPLVMCSACFRGAWRETRHGSGGGVQRSSAADVAVFPTHCRCDSCRLGAGSAAVAEKMLTDTIIDIVSTFGRTGATSNDVLRCLHACCFRNSRMQSRWRIGIHRDRGPFGRREWRRGRVQARVRSILSRSSCKRVLLVDPKPLQRIARKRHRHTGVGSASETELAYVAIHHADDGSRSSALSSSDTAAVVAATAASAAAARLNGSSPQTAAGAAAAAAAVSADGSAGLRLEVVISPLVRMEVALPAQFVQLAAAENGSIIRRYSDLLWLRSALSTAYPTIDVPILPEQSAPSPDVVALAMERIAQHAQLAASPELRMFLRSSDPQDFANSRSRLASCGMTGIIASTFGGGTRTAARSNLHGRSRSAKLSSPASGTLNRTLRLFRLGRKVRSGSSDSSSNGTLRSGGGSSASASQRISRSPTHLEVERWKRLERINGSSYQMVSTMRGVVAQTINLQRKIASLSSYERQRGVAQLPHANAPQAPSPPSSSSSSAAAASPPSKKTLGAKTVIRNPHYREQMRSGRTSSEVSSAFALSSRASNATHARGGERTAFDANCEASGQLLAKLKDTMAEAVSSEPKAHGGGGGSGDTPPWTSAVASLVEGYFGDLEESSPDAVPVPTRVSSVMVALQMVANNERGRLVRTRAMWQSLLPQLLALQRAARASEAPRHAGDSQGQAPGFTNVDAWMSAEWLIDESLLKVEAHLGKGAFGTVSRGTMGGAPVAIKTFLIDLKGPKREQLLRDFLSEAHNMSRLPPHPNVVQFIGACVSPKGLSLVIEFLPRGDLRSLLLGDDSLSFAERLRLAMEVATGVHALHQLTPPLLHRDLKSSNCCLDHELRVKVVDFGLSAFHWEKKSGGAGEDDDDLPTGTAAWMAPELIEGDGEASVKSDVYSFGILIWSLLTRAEPYAGLPLSSLMYKVVRDGLRPPRPHRVCPGSIAASERVAFCSREVVLSEGASEEVVDDGFEELVALLVECLDEDPHARPDLGSIISRLHNLRLRQKKRRR